MVQGFLFAGLGREGSGLLGWGFWGGGGGYGIHRGSVLCLRSFGFLVHVAFSGFYAFESAAVSWVHNGRFTRAL